MKYWQGNKTLYNPTEPVNSQLTLTESLKEDLLPPATCAITAKEKTRDLCDSQLIDLSLTLQHFYGVYDDE